MLRLFLPSSIARASFFWLVLASSAYPQGLLSDSQQGEPQTYKIIAKDIGSRIGEFCFWSGVPLPAIEMRMIIFESTDRRSGREQSDFDLLVVVPDANATYEYRLRGERPLLVSREEQMRTWPFPGSMKIGPDDYLKQQLSRFSDFISHAKKSDQVLPVSKDPAALFQVNAAFKARRITQIKSAATALFHKRPLRIRISNFSEFTQQIDALLPDLGEMVTFSVLHQGSKDETVAVGRETSLKSLREGLRERIEANSTLVVVK